MGNTISARISSSGPPGHLPLRFSTASAVVASVAWEEGNGGPVLGTWALGVRVWAAAAPTAVGVASPWEPAHVCCRAVEQLAYLEGGGVGCRPLHSGHGTSRGPGRSVLGQRRNRGRCVCRQGSIYNVVSP